MRHLVVINLEFETSALSNFTPEMEKEFSNHMAFVIGTEQVANVYRRVAEKMKASLYRYTVVGMGRVGKEVSPLDGKPALEVLPESVDHEDAAAHLREKGAEQ